MTGWHRCAGEEGSAAQGSTDPLTDAPTWLVDPLDGTTNFVHRQPNVCVSIALAVRRQVWDALCLMNSIRPGEAVICFICQQQQQQQRTHDP